jgi:short-subunit dehydrogenase
MMKSYLMITGATGGLGSAFVLEAAKNGYDLLLTDLAPEGQGFANRLSEKFNIEVLYKPCDLSVEESRTQLLNEIKQEDYRFWGLINVAGLDHEGAFLEKSRAQILKVLHINIVATMDLTHGILPLHDPEKRFRLINVCSLAGFFPMPYKATYAASKRFLLDISRALREEIKSFGTVTALCPSGMPTTVECMRSMFAQGFWGLATGMAPADVARITLKAALKGRAVVIPGFINQFIQGLSSLVPTSLSIRYVAKRWSKARAKLEDPFYLKDAFLQSVKP